MCVSILRFRDEVILRTAYRHSAADAVVLSLVLVVLLPPLHPPPSSPTTTTAAWRCGDRLSVHQDLLQPSAGFIHRVTSSLRHTASILIPLSSRLSLSQEGTARLTSSR